MAPDTASFWPCGLRRGVGEERWAAELVAGQITPLEEAAALALDRAKGG